MSVEKVFNIGGHAIQCTHLDKILFPDSKITKEDLIIYYKNIAPYALPFYRNYPLTMFRCPNGIKGQIFIQKETPSYFPEWVARHEVYFKEEPILQTLVNNEATFVYLANQACVSFHLSLSKINKLKSPSYLIFDLDPSFEDLKLLKKVIGRMKVILDYLSIVAFLQTTGSRGFHIYIPLKNGFTFKETRDFAKIFASYLVQEYPNEITITYSKEKRGKKVLIDYARNTYGFNIIAPFSVRTLEKAPVATPIFWEELEDKNLNAQSYNINNIFKRLNEIENPWSEMKHHQISLKSLRNKISQLNRAVSV